MLSEKAFQGHCDMGFIAENAVSADSWKILCVFHL